MIINNIIFYILLGIIAILVAWVIYTEIRLKKLLAGKNAASLEEVFSSLIKDLDKVKAGANQTEMNIASMEKRIKKSVQGLGAVRFNPFQDSGGNQSFAVAMLNEHGDGVILSSLYGRERMSVFAKPVKNHESEYELTAEEKEALAKAKLS